MVSFQVDQHTQTSEGEDQYCELSEEGIFVQLWVETTRIF
jgi:hypothetical protein